MPRGTNKYPEVENIKSDINSLKENTIELTKHVKKDGKVKTAELKHALSEKMDVMTEKGQDRLRDIEFKVREKPLQAVGIAFAAGLLASILMGRR